jgi:hypothetical protein
VAGFADSRWKISRPSFRRFADEAGQQGVDCSLLSRATAS